MASYYDLVTFREDVDTKESTIDAVTRGPLPAPQVSYKSGWRSSSLSEKTAVEAVSEKKTEDSWQRRRSEDVGPKDLVDTFVLEKKTRFENDSDRSAPVSPISLPKPSLPPLTIPKAEHFSPPPSPSLPPRDTGWAAWSVLIAATVVSSFSCGFYLCFGVFQAYYISHAEFGHGSQSALIGVLSSGLTFMVAPIMTYLCQHLSLPRIHYVWMGWLVCIVALVSAAFCKTIPTLIVTQGLLYGIGVALNDNPMMIIVNTWFLHRRGIAYGIVFGFADLTGVGWSFLANHLLQRYGLRTTFLIFAGIIGFGSGPFILLLKERGATTIFNRASEASRRRTPDEDILASAVGGNFDLIRRNTPPTRQRYFRRPIFYVLFISNLAQAFAFYLPLIYLPSYATDLGFNSNKGAIVLAIANLAQIIGEIGFGKLSDKINVYILVVISSTTAAVSTFFLWGHAKNLGMLLTYAFIFGLSGSGYIALWARMGILFGERDAQMVYSFMCAGRGLGSIISGPISTTLVRSVVNDGLYGNGKYKFLVVFVGTSMAVSAALGILGAFTALGNVTNWFQRRISVAKSPMTIRSELRY